MNDCNGAGLCGTNGQCGCFNSMTKGADCAYKAAYNDPAKDLQGWSCSTKGTEWCYFVLTKEMASKDMEIALLSKNANVNVYIGYGEDSNPGKFEYDIIFKNLTANRKLALSRNNIPTDGGYTIAVEVLGYDYGKNTPNDNIVNIDSKVRGSPESDIIERQPIYGRTPGSSNLEETYLFM